MERLDIYLDALDRADADHFPPCCAECECFVRIVINGFCLHKAEFVRPHFLCDHYEAPAPPDDIPY